MTAYRLYFLDLAKHIREVTVIDSECDESACSEADRLADGRPMELWLRDRLVRSWDGDF